MSSDSSSLTVPRTLCQPPDGDRSCGACCGMYNQRTQTSSYVLLEALRLRTLAFHRETSVNAPATFPAFRARHEPRPDEKLLDGLPSCPFLGVLARNADTLERDAGSLESTRQARVGCLVHPLQHDGLDLRDCGVYDRFICEDYLCAAHDVMKHEEKWLVLVAVKESYLYGLVITDTRFVRELFELTARMNGAYPSMRVLQRPGAVEAAQQYFELKRDWVYRHPVHGIFGQVVPAHDLDTTRRPGPSEALQVPPDVHESILRCLGTEVSSVQMLERARALVRDCVARFARATQLDAPAPQGA